MKRMLTGAGRRSALGLLLAHLGAAAVLAAGGGAASPAETARVLAQWRDELDRGARLLEAGEHAKARKTSLNLLEQMTRLLGEGNEAADYLGRAIVLRALAESGLGDVDATFWYWDVARGIDPDVEKLDFARFGAAGKRIRGAARPEIAAADFETLNFDGDVVPPRVRKRVRPEFPLGARVLKTEGQLIVQVIIEADGKLSHPTVVQPLPAPALTYTALEAVRKWRFEPATLAGQPIQVYYNLTVNYKLQR